MPTVPTSAQRVLVFRRDPFHLLATGEVRDGRVNLAVCDGVIIPPRVRNLLPAFIAVGGVCGHFDIPGSCEIGWRVEPAKGGAA